MNRVHETILVRDFPLFWNELAEALEAEAKAGEVVASKQLAEQWFVYILQCADGSLYTGVTKDLDRRLEQHSAGTASRYTRSRLPVILVYHEEPTTKGGALKRELSIKSLSRKAKEALIQSMN